MQQVSVVDAVFRLRRCCGAAATSTVDAARATRFVHIGTAYHPTTCRLQCRVFYICREPVYTYDTHVCSAVLTLTTLLKLRRALLLTASSTCMHTTAALADSKPASEVLKQGEAPPGTGVPFLNLTYRVGAHLVVCGQPECTRHSGCGSGQAAPLCRLTLLRLMASSRSGPCGYLRSCPWGLACSPICALRTQVPGLEAAVALIHNLIGSKPWAGFHCASVAVVRA